MRSRASSISLAPVPENSTDDGPEVIATNTLILTNVPPRVFLTDDGIANVKATLEKFGDLKAVVPLKTFGRILVVYAATASAQAARAQLQNSDSIGIDVGVYFGEHTDTTYLADPNAGTNLSHLRVPDLEKNFLLSPPGSPPIDWTQIRESGPVPGGHADALLDALRELEHADAFSLGDSAHMDMDPPAFDQAEFSLPIPDSSHGTLHNTHLNNPHDLRIFTTDEDDGGGDSADSDAHRQTLNFRPTREAQEKGLSVLPLIVVENTEAPSTPTKLMPRTALPPRTLLSS
ncbi:Calcipressin-domain-containing protein [Gaertneriomyces semiglobifer]|nr:Calcipressin-domain-containing protein [Gaertneriomyces semiglobifer]